MSYMPANDAPLGNRAEAYVTIDGTRYHMLTATKFEANFNVETKEVPVLGKLVKGRKATCASIKFSMTIYKVTEIFDKLVEEFKNEGLLPTFDIQVTNYDKASSCGRSSKIYRDCMLDGDVLLSMIDAEGGFIEQTISGYCDDFSSAERYTNPQYM